VGWLCVAVGLGLMWRCCSAVLLLLLCVCVSLYSVAVRVRGCWLLQVVGAGLIRYAALPCQPAGE